MSTHDININLTITVTVDTDGGVVGVSARSDDLASGVATAGSVVPGEAEPLTSEDLRELAAPYKKQFVITKKELEELTKDEIIALGQGMLGIEIYKRQHKDDIIAEFWREYKARY